jgi:hypothetical protein
MGGGHNRQALAPAVRKAYSKRLNAQPVEIHGVDSELQAFWWLGCNCFLFKAPHAIKENQRRHGGGGAGVVRLCAAPFTARTPRAGEQAILLRSHMQCCADWRGSGAVSRWCGRHTWCVGSGRTISG